MKLIYIIILLFTINRVSAQTLNPGLEINKIYEFKLQTINGIHIDSEKDLKGKIIVLNFWFIGCQPCLKEIPELNSLTIQYDSSKISFIAISPTDSKEALDYVQKRLKMKFLLVGPNPSIAKNFNVNDFPVNIILDKEHRLVFFKRGYAENNITEANAILKEIAH